MKLYLLRHGEAEPYRSDDASRALTRVGCDAVVTRGEALAPVDQLFCSPYVRARQSADLVQQRLGQNIQIEPLLTPDQPVKAVIDWLQTLPEGDTCLIGHNPLLSQLANTLLGESSTVSLSTAGLVCLEADAWYPGGATLSFQH